MPSAPSEVVTRASTCQFASTVRAPATYGRSTGTRTTLTATCAIFIGSLLLIVDMGGARRTPHAPHAPRHGKAAPVRECHSLDCLTMNRPIRQPARQRGGDSATEQDQADVA